jgi:hypothetical protein
MILQIRFRPKALLALLIMVFTLVIFSFFFYEKIENIVHAELYSYGLIFSYEWVNPYWATSHMFLYFSWFATISYGISIVFFLIYLRNQKAAISSYICSLLLVVGAGLSFFSIYFFIRLNYIVNHDLYFYGLISSDEWLSGYSLYAGLLFSFIAFAGVLALVTSVFMYLSSRKTVRIVPTKLVNSILIAIGTLSLTFSIIYASSLLTLIGLGLLFWGVTFTYVSTEEYIKKVLLQTSASAQLTRLNQVIEELEFMGNPMYLPPQYFKKRDTYKAYIPKDRLALIPTPEQMYNQEPKFFIDFIDTPPAVLMTPPGAELVQLFETMLKKNFSEVDLVYIQQHLPKLLIEDLEIVHYFDIAIENETVRIKIEDSVYNVSKTEPEHTDIYSSFGSPLSSALACILAKVANSPVVTAPQNGTENRSETIEYRILRLEGETGK